MSSSVNFLDNGAGIPQNLTGKVFKSNFSTKQDGEGIGLAIARRILADNGATIQVGLVQNKPELKTNLQIVFEL